MEAKERSGASLASLQEAGPSTRPTASQNHSPAPAQILLRQPALNLNRDQQAPSAPHPIGSKQIHIDVSALPPGLSKNAAKKLARKQKYEETKSERRAAERAKRKLNKRARWLASQPTSSSIETEAQSGTHDSLLNGNHGTNEAADNKKRAAAQDGDHDLDLDETASDQHVRSNKKARLDSIKKKKEYFGAKLVIDCGFDELMSDKEISSLSQQLMYLYSNNKSSQLPFSEIILTGPSSTSAVQYLSKDQHHLVPKAIEVETIPQASTVEPEIDLVDRAKVDIGKVPNFHDSGVGTAMNGKMRGVWRRWKGVTIYEEGGLERLVAGLSKGSTGSTTNGEGPASDASAVNGEEERAGDAAQHRPPTSHREKQAAGRIAVEKTIYLTADVDETITELDPSCTYIIGGIVDKNRYKNLCSNKARQLGLRTAKLPLTKENLQAVDRTSQPPSQVDEISHPQQQQDSRGEDKQFKGRKVLTVNQVVEILLGWTETRDWVKAIDKSVPKRRFSENQADTVDQGQGSDSEGPERKNVERHCQPASGGPRNVTEAVLREDHSKNGQDEDEDAKRNEV